MRFVWKNSSAKNTMETSGLGSQGHPQFCISSSHSLTKIAPLVTFFSVHLKEFIMPPKAPKREEMSQLVVSRAVGAHLLNRSLARLFGDAELWIMPTFLLIPFDDSIMWRESFICK